MRKLSWRTKLMALFAVVLGASLLFQLFCVIPRLRKREVEMIKMHQEQVVRNIARELDTELTQTYGRLVKIAERAEFRRMDIPAQQETINTIAKGSYRFQSLFVMNADGWFISGSVDDLSPHTSRSYADRPFFTVPFKKGETYFGPPTFYRQEKLVALSVSVPIESEAGEKVGVLIGGFRLNNLIDTVRNYRLAEGQVLYVVDKEGTVVAQSGKDLFALKDGPLSLNYSHRPMVQAVMRGEKAEPREYDHDGASYFGTCAILKSNGWGVVVTASMRAILARSSALARRLLMINIGLFAIALIVSLIFGRQIMGEQMRTHEALRQSEELFRLVVEGAFDGINVCEFDPVTIKRRLLFCNDRYVEMSGYTREELTSADDLNQLVIQHHPQEERAYHYNCIVNGVPFTGSASWKRPDGKENTYEWSAISIKKGDNYQIIGVDRDITERKRAHDALRRSEQKYRLLAENARDVIFTQDMDLNLIYVSPSGADLFGYSIEEGLTLRMEDFLTADSLKKATESFQESAALAREGRDIDVPPMEYEYVRKDGSTFWGELRTTFMRDPTGYLVGVLGVLRDLTERKRAEEKLRESEIRLRTLLEGIPEGVLVHDEDGNILYTNDVTAKRFEWSAAELVGRSLREFITPENLSLVGNHVTRARTDGACTFETTYVSRTGRHIRAEVNERPIEFEGKSAILSVARDITERKRAAEERRKLEAKIQHAQRLESLGVLAGGIAHDFNNLLTGILGNASLATNELAPQSPARDSIQQIEASALRAADLCKQMLAYAGKGRFVVQPTNLSRLVEEMDYLLEAVTSKKTVLKYSLEDNLPAVHADATQIRQVIVNLVTNASEAIGEKSGVITVSTGVAEVDRGYLSGTYLGDGLADGFYVFLEVSDTGCGMDEETMAKVFDPFFTTKFTGRGLGLAAVLGIVRGHNGAIKIYSELGRGTTFKILLPCCETSALETGDAEEGATTEWQGSGTILVVDDVDTVRSTAKMMLERLGFTVLTADDGRRGVEVFRDHADEIVLVLLDLTMPHMGGEDAFREMRRIRSDVRVILSSGYDEQEAVNRFAGKGLAAFLQKPYRVATLIAKLREVLES